MGPTNTQYQPTQAQPVAGTQVMPQPVAGTVPNRPATVKATLVLIFSDRAFFNSSLGVLVWYQDNTIELVATQNGMQQSVFYCSPQDITKFSYFTNHTTIQLRNGQTFFIGFNLDYNENLIASTSIDAATNMMGGGAFSLGFYFGADGLKKDIKTFTMDSANDSAWWVESLGRFGVNAKRTTTTKLTLIILGGGFCLLIIVAFVIAAVSTFSQ